jgi:selenocysteine-specific elongation factor
MIAGDRFVLRDWGKRSTIAGGVVLDPEAAPRRFRKPHQLAFLEAGGLAAEDARVVVSNLLKRDASVAPDAAFAKTAFSDEDITRAVDAAVAAGDAVRRRAFLLDADWWNGILDDAGDCIRQHHAANPDRASISIASLRGKLSIKLQPLLFDQLVIDLSKNGFVKTPNGVRAADHVPNLPSELGAVRKDILGILAENPLEPPNPKEFATTDEKRKVLRFLIEIGEVVDLGDKCALLAASFESLRDQIVSRLEKGPATASEIRESIGTTRRILIPTLEKLDAEGVTVRDGDLRSLKKS